MSIEKADAFIIKGFRYGDSSKIITIFSREFGKFNALVKSTRSMKSKTSGIFENLNLISVFFNRKENRDLQFFSKGDCINPFSKIKCSLDKLSAAYRIVEMVNYSTHEYHRNEELFELLERSLISLNKDGNNSLVSLVYFQANLAKNLGIKPELIEYHPTNGKAGNETFNHSNALKLNRIEYPFVSSLFEKEGSPPGNMGLDNTGLERIGNVLDIYISNHLDKSGYLKTKSILSEINI